MRPSPQKPAALVHLGREQALGDVRRVASWHLTLAAAGFDAADVPLLPGLRSSWTEAAGRLPSLVRSSAAMPESLAWSPRRLRRELDGIGPELVVCITGRAFDPIASVGPWTTVLDYVDRLSVSYHDRSRIAEHRSTRLLYRLLSPLAARFERKPAAGTVRVAAGWSDARHLDAVWLPNVVELPAPPERNPDRDVLFVGTLSFPPNIAAVQRLARLWPHVRRRRPQTTVLVAGARPSTSLVSLVEAQGWELAPDFKDPEPIYGRAAVAVVPLSHASGLQNKVIDAAANGLAQVADPAGLAGVGPEFPALSATKDEDFAAAIVELLDNHELRMRLGTESRQHVAKMFSTTRSALRLRDALGSTYRPPSPTTLRIVRPMMRRSSERLW